VKSITAREYVTRMPCQQLTCNALRLSIVRNVSQVSHTIKVGQQLCRRRVISWAIH